MSNIIPPTLLYLVIYNPALNPPDSARTDDEDAEEQAHVLFYTANSHAVSKDRVLRQVGLAKALTNFTTIFEPRTSCESIHSQSRRMVMISPEPDFWIHACFELERTLRVPRKDEKGKGKHKETTYDYNEASLHDSALRTRLILGYEAFKVAHGSFTSILKHLSREALEIQLERFFTVWAWSWDLGKQVSFSDYLGVRVHPLSSQLLPLIDIFEDKLPPHYFPLVLISSCIVASKSALLPCPAALIRYFLHVLENRASQSRQLDETVDDVNVPQGPQASSAQVKDSKHAKSSSKTFLGMPGLNMDVNMDIRKWNWPGYLTFGLGGHQSSHTSHSVGPVAEKTGLETLTDSQPEPNKNITGIPQIPQFDTETPVDSQSLKEALSSEASPYIAPASESDQLVEISASLASSQHGAPNSDAVSTALDTPRESSMERPDLDRGPMSTVDEISPILRPLHSFSELQVHLSNSDPIDTHDRLVRCLYMDNTLLALLSSSECEHADVDATAWQALADRSVELIERLKEIVEVEQEKISSAFSPSPVQSVLQKSQHVINTADQLTYSSSSFSATSWHLQEGRKALEIEPHLLEIYSRGQNPQDWHLVKRGLGANVRGEVYMDIGRKEASLVDVDNEIMGVLRRFSE